MPIFCERLKELRLENRLSSKQLAKELQVDFGTICRWERGERVPSIIHLRNIAIFFKVSADYLIGLED